MYSTRTIQTRRGPIHGITEALALGGYYTHTTKTGRRVAISKRTRRLLEAHNG